VNHRHLLPDEIDQLVDGEAGFGVAQLRAHLRDCGECRARLEDARLVTQTLERLPRLAPSPGFADRVMGQVHVYVPWHVTALATAQRWTPQSRPLRVIAAATALSIASLLTVASLWMVARLDLLAYLAGAAAGRLRDAVLGAAGSALAALFGRPVLDTLRASGMAGVIIALLVLVATTAGAVLALRAFAVASARRRG
jgi:hypothetical protein